jgi:hypothetical protein
LMSLVRSRAAEARLVERARIVLACLEGKLDLPRFSGEALAHSAAIFSN